MDFNTFILGLVVVAIGFLVLIVNLYINNKDQGMVAESNFIFALLFGIFDWKRNKIPLLIIGVGLVMVVVPMVI